MNKREIEKQALNSLNTYFKDNPDKVLNDFERKPLDKEDITKIVNEEIQAQEKKVESLEVLRKNIAINTINKIRSFFIIVLLMLLTKYRE